MANLLEQEQRVGTTGGTAAAIKHDRGSNGLASYPSLIYIDMEQGFFRALIKQTFSRRLMAL